MTAKQPSLKKLLSAKKFPTVDTSNTDERLKNLQLQMLRIQQGIWHSKRRTLILFEGFDASGKGGAINRLIEPLDSRGVMVYPFGPPTPEEQGKHYLYRFWTKLPAPGCISIFDRTWYGRVLVERIEKLTPKNRWLQAYDEINQTEKILFDDGIDIVKIFLAISAKEQMKRFQQRLNDPYKQWKLTPDDIEARKHWNGYVKATDDMLKKTNNPFAPWHLVLACDKLYTRIKVLEIVTSALHHHYKWIENQAHHYKIKDLKKALKQVKIIK